MNKFLKYASIAVGGILAVVIAVATYVAMTFNPNDYKPQIVQLVKEKFDRSLDIEGDLKLTLFPALGAELGPLAISEHAAAGEFAAMDGARVSLQFMPLLSRELVVSEVEVRGLRANLVKHKDGTTNADDFTGGGAAKPAQAPKPAAGAGATSAQKPMRFDIDHVLVDNASLAYADEGSNAKYTISKLSLKTGRIAAATPSDLELSLSLGATQPAMNLDLQLKTRLAFDPAAETIELGKLAVGITYTDPKSPRGPIKLNLTGDARADMKKHSASLDFSTKFDDSTINGKFALSQTSPPAFVFDLDVDKLDVDRYTGGRKPGGKAVDADKGAAAHAEQPLDFSARKTLQAKGSVKIGSLKAANLRVENLRLDLKAGGGRLDVNPMAASLYQGSVTGSASLVASAVPQIAVKQSLAGISIGPLLKDAIDKDLLEGKGSVTLDVSGQGATVSAIKKALSGSASVNFVDGALKGINIGASIRDAKAKLGALKGEATQQSNAADKTDFSELKASFAIRNGVAHNSDLSMKSPLLRLGGEGDINIGADSMDYLAKATLVATAAGQGGKEVSDLSGITVPVRISGPFTSLTYKLDFNAMIGGAAKQKIEEQKEAVKAKVQDKVKGQLKGLFGR